MVRSDYLSVAIAGASIFSMGGVIFGIASLYPILYYERALEDSCGTPVGLDEAGNSCSVHSRESCCDAQQLQFTSVTSAALFAADGAMLAYGELGDRLGPRACFGTGASLAWLGLVLLAAAAHTGADALWYMSLLCIGVSGPGVFMGCLFLGEKYPRLRAVISSVGAAMWDGSALVFQLFGLTYFATVPSGAALAADDPAAMPSISLTAISLFWSTWCLLIGAATFKALPTREYLEQLRAAEGQSAEPLQQAEDFEIKSATTPTVAGDDAAPGTAPPASFLSHFNRTDTRLLLCFMGLFNLKSSFYIATFATQMNGMFFSPTADSLAQTFNIAFPIGGFCTSAIASVLLDRLGEREDLYMTLVVLLAIMFGIYNLMPYASSQFASALLFGPTRTLQWACYFHFLSLPKRYPPQYVGRLLGYGNLIIALVGDVPLTLLNSFVVYTEEMGSQSARFLFVHFVLQLALIGCLVFPWYLHKQFSARGTAHLNAAREDVDGPSSEYFERRSKRSDSDDRYADDAAETFPRTRSSAADDDDDESGGGSSRGVELVGVAPQQQTVPDGDDASAAAASPPPAPTAAPALPKLSAPPGDFTDRPVSPVAPPPSRPSAVNLDMD